MHGRALAQFRSSKVHAYVCVCVCVRARANASLSLFLFFFFSCFCFFSWALRLCAPLYSRCVACRPFSPRTVVRVPVVPPRLPSLPCICFASAWRPIWPAYSPLYRCCYGTCANVLGWPSRPRRCCITRSTGSHRWTAGQRTKFMWELRPAMRRAHLFFCTTGTAVLHDASDAKRQKDTHQS